MKKDKESNGDRENNERWREIRQQKINRNKERENDVKEERKEKRKRKRKEYSVTVDESKGKSVREIGQKSEKRNSQSIREEDQTEWEIRDDGYCFKIMQ